VAKSTLTWKKFSDHNEPFIIREGLSYEELMLIEAEMRKAAEKKYQEEERIAKAKAEEAKKKLAETGIDVVEYETESTEEQQDNFGERENDVSDWI
jgi:hypothetical protein